jgi:hypothetical protein
LASPLGWDYLQERSRPYWMSKLRDLDMGQWSDPGQCSVFAERVPSGLSAAQLSSPAGSFNSSWSAPVVASHTRALGGTTGVKGVAFSPDGTRIVTVGGGLFPFLRVGL